jgi:hypothetical protein
MGRWEEKEMNEIKLKGRLVISDPKTGKVLREADNIITNVGKTRALQVLTGQNNSPFVKGTIGSSNTTPAATDTALGSQLDEATPTVSVSGSQATIVTLHTAASNWTIQEYALKTSDGVILNRVTFSAISLPAGGQLQFTYYLSIA